MDRAAASTGKRPTSCRATAALTTRMRARTSPHVWGVDAADLTGTGHVRLRAARLAMGEDGGIRGLFVMGSNPVGLGARMPNDVSARLESLDLLVVSRFLSLGDGGAGRRRAAVGAVGGGRRHDDQPRRACAPPPPSRRAAARRPHRPRRLSRPRGAPSASARGSRPSPRARCFEELRTATAGGPAGLRGHHLRAHRRARRRVLAVPIRAPSGHPALFAERFSHADGRARFHRVRHLSRRRGAGRRVSVLSHDRTRAGALPIRHANAARRDSCCKAQPRSRLPRCTPPRRGGCGIADSGCRVTIATRRGQASFAAELTAGIREDTIFVPFHWGGRAVGQPADERRTRPDQPDARVQGVRRARGREQRHARTKHR